MDVGANSTSYAPSLAPTAAPLLAVPTAAPTTLGVGDASTHRPTTLIHPSLGGYLDAMGMLTNASMLLALIAFAAYVVAPWARKRSAKREFSRIATRSAVGAENDEGLAMVSGNNGTGCGASGGSRGRGGGDDDDEDASHDELAWGGKSVMSAITNSKVPPPPKGSAQGLAKHGGLAALAGSSVGGRGAKGTSAADVAASSALMRNDTEYQEAWADEVTSCVI